MVGLANLLITIPAVTKRLFSAAAPVVVRISVAMLNNAGRLRDQYLRLSPLAKKGVHIAICIGFVTCTFITLPGKTTSNTTEKSNQIPVAAPSQSTPQEDLHAGRQLLELAKTEQQRLQAETQHRLAIERAAAREQAAIYQERVRRQQFESARYQQQAIQIQHEAQQRVSERANYEIQRYRRQMTGRPGF